MSVVLLLHCWVSCVIVWFSVQRCCWSRSFQTWPTDGSNADVQQSTADRRRQCRGSGC